MGSGSKPSKEGLAMGRETQMDHEAADRPSDVVVE
jgi:hypothetical protein